jgi:hypothetical protein
LPISHMISGVVIESITPPTFLGPIRFSRDASVVIAPSRSLLSFSENGMTRSRLPILAEASDLVARDLLLLHRPAHYFRFRRMVLRDHASIPNQ